MKVRKYFSLPVEFTENKSFSFDDSLIPVDIKVMHNGLNLNNSTFFDEAIEDAKESLKNKPILGYVRKADGSDEKDFSGHEVEISFGEEGLKVTYLERPLGTVPETNNYSILEEDGKKFVFCRGYLWKEYLNSGYEILKDNPNKSVSMEIAVDDYDINDDGSINITKYRYLGITILGDDVTAAMTGAELNVVGHFTKNENEDFYNKIEELNYKISQHFAFNKQEDTFEGGENLEDNKLFEEDEVVETIEVVEEEVPTTEEVEETPVDTSDEEAVEEEIVEEDFELKYNELLEKFNELEVDYKTLESEVVELKEFKATKEKEEFEVKQEELRQEKINHINTEYENISDDIKELFISKVDEYETTDDIDADLCVYIVKNKVTFSKVKKEATPVKVSVEENTQNPVASPYGDLF